MAWGRIEKTEEFQDLCSYCGRYFRNARGKHLRFCTALKVQQQRQKSQRVRKRKAPQTHPDYTGLFPEAGSSNGHQHSQNNEYEDPYSQDLITDNDSVGMNPDCPLPASICGSGQDRTQSLDDVTVALFDVIPRLPKATATNLIKVLCQNMPLPYTSYDQFISFAAEQSDGWVCMI